VECHCHWAPVVRSFGDYAFQRASENAVKTKSGKLNSSTDLCRLARVRWVQDRTRSAVETAWAAFDLDSSDRDVKQLLVNLLHSFPSELVAERRRAFLELLTDREVEPNILSPAGWHLVLRSHDTEDTLGAAKFEPLALAFGSDDLAIALLRE